MRERLIDLLDWDCGWIEAPAKEVADYLLERGVIHIPCKVGDIVYQTDGVNVYENEVCEISLSKRAVIYYTENAVAFDETALGKSIFLTRQEAEAKLK